MKYVIWCYLVYFKVFFLNTNNVIYKCHCYMLSQILQCIMVFIAWLNYSPGETVCSKMGIKCTDISILACKFKTNGTFNTKKIYLEFNWLWLFLAEVSEEDIWAFCRYPFYCKILLSSHNPVNHSRTCHICISVDIK